MIVVTRTTYLEMFAECRLAIADRATLRSLNPCHKNSAISHAAPLPQ